MQLMVSGAEYCIFAVRNHNDNDEKAKLIVYPDLEYQVLLRNELMTFHQKIIDGSDYSENDSALISLLSELKEVQEKLDELKEKESNLKKDIFKLSPKSKYVIGGAKITQSKSDDKLVPDFKEYCFKNDVDLSAFQKIQKGRKTQRITFLKEEK